MKIDEMEERRAMDVWIAEKLFGWTAIADRGLDAQSGTYKYGLAKPGDHNFSRVPCYSTKIEDAWKIIRKLGLMIHPAGLGSNGEPSAYWVGFPSDGWLGLVGDMQNETIASDENEAFAICKSARKVISLREAA